MLASNAAYGNCVVKPLYAEKNPLTMGKLGTEQTLSALF